MVRFLNYLWAAPATVVGLLFVVLAWLSRGRVRIVAGVLEVHGGLVSVFLRRGLGPLGSAAARTLGHVIIGADQTCLDSCRVHEQTHVRQFERWGPLLLPLYLFSSFRAWQQGRDPYLDNVFEREAIEAARRSEQAGPTNA